ncbi:MAG: LEPR-XLL domain-containing protein, partial [bacterium]|nr:LEPR-XLL domain-containing protein [bacterium]
MMVPPFALVDSESRSSNNILHRAGGLPRICSILRNAYQLANRLRVETPRSAYRRASLEPMEPRLLLDGDLTYAAMTDGDLTVRLDPTDSGILQVVETGTGTVLANEALGNLDGRAGYAVKLNTNNQSVVFRIDANVLAAQQVIDAGGIVFEGGTGSDTLAIDGQANTWIVTGLGEGSVNEGAVRFSSVENLRGADVFDDTFIIEAGGDLAGGLEGGEAGFDVMDIQGEYGRIIATATGPTSGSVTLDDKTIYYSGLEPITIASTSGTTVTINATDADDFLYLEDDPENANSFRLVSQNGTMESLSFRYGDVDTLIINTGEGADTFSSSDNLESSFSANVILMAIEEVELGSLELPEEFTVVANQITVLADSTLDVDGTIDFFAPTILIEDGVTMNAGGDIRLTAEGNVPMTWLNSIPVFKQKIAEAKIEIGDATLTAEDVIIRASTTTEIMIEVVVDEITLEDLLPSMLRGGVSGTPTITFTDNSTSDTDTRDTLTRSDGTLWSADGFAAGQFIEIYGTEFNDGIYQIAAIDDTTNTLTLMTGYELVAESATEVSIQTVTAMTGNPTLTFQGNTLTRNDKTWAEDGFVAGKYITISGSNVLLTMTGNPHLTFTQNATGADTITRLDGKNWEDDWFEVGQWIKVTGSSGNNGEYKIAAIAGTVLTLEESVNLSNEANAGGVAIQAFVKMEGVTELSFSDNGENPDTITRSEGSWVNDGFEAGQEIRIAGTANNNGTYKIDSVDDTEIVLVAEAVLTDETLTSGVSIKGDLFLTNDGTYRIKEFDAVNGKILILDPTETFVNEVAQGHTVISEDVSAAELPLAILDPNSGMAGDPELHFRFNKDEMRDAPSLTFAPNASGNGTLTRSEGSWIDDGFEVGQRFVVAGTAHNDNTVGVPYYTIGAISSDGKTITLEEENNGAVGDFFSGETTTAGDYNVTVTGISQDTITRSEGSWVMDGFTAGQLISVSGTDGNDGTYRILSLTDTVITLEDNYTLVEEITSGVSVKPIVPTKIGDQPLTAQDFLDFISGTTMPIASKISDLIMKFAPIKFNVWFCESTSIITVGADITATGDISITSEATSIASVKTPSTIVGATYANSAATAKAIIESTSTISAGGDFALNASVVNNLSASTAVTKGIQKMIQDRLFKMPSGPSIFFTMGQASSTTQAGVDSGASVTVGGKADVTAHNDNDFVVATKSMVAKPNKNMGQAIGVSVSDVSSLAEAYVSGSLIANGDVLLDAHSINANNDVTAKAATKDKPATAKFNKVAKTLKANSIASKFDAKGGQSSKVGIGAAVAVGLSSNEAKAYVGDGGVVQSGNFITPADDSTILGLQIKSLAEDNFQASAIGGSKAKAEVAIGGAVLITNYKNHSDAHIGDNANVKTTKDLLITSDALIPNQIALIDDFYALKQWFNSVSNAFHWDGPTTDFPSGIDPNDPATIDSYLTQGSAYFSEIFTEGAENLTTFIQPLSTILGYVRIKKVIPTKVATTYTEVTAKSPKEKDSSGNSKATGKYAVGGVVNVLGVENDSKAYIGKNSVVEAEKIDILSDTLIETIDIAGTSSLLSLVRLGVGPTAEGGAVGGTFNGVTYNNSSKAYIDDGSQVTARTGDLRVISTADNFLITFTQSGAKGKKFAVSGAVGYNNIDNTSLAYIEDQAKVSAGKDVILDASHDFLVVDIAGAIQMGEKFAAGASVAINDIDNVVQAFIGDIGRVTGTYNPTLTGLTFTPGVTAGEDITLDATSHQQVYSFTIAGTHTKGSKPAQSDDPLDGESLPLLFGEEPTTKAQNSGGVGVSGSVSINLVTDNVQSFIHGLDAANQYLVLGSSGDLTLNAENTIFGLAVSGGIVINTSGGGASIAGAFSLNDYDRITKAYTENANITTQDVYLNAYTKNQLIAVTAGVAGGKMKEKFNLAGSVNLGLLDNETVAAIGDHTTLIASGDVLIRAENDLSIIAVAGAITWAGKVAVGAAADVSVVNNTVSASIGKNAVVDADGNIAILADSDHFFLSIGASLGVAKEKLGLVGSVSSQNLDSTVSAFIGENANVETTKNLLIDAQDIVDFFVIAGGFAFGKEGAAGVSLANTNIKRNLNAYIANGAHVDAYAQGDGSVTIRKGATPAEDETVDVDGIQINANADEHLYSFAAGGQVSKKFAGGVTLSVSTIDSTTNAYIGDADINQETAHTKDSDQSVRVAATHDTFIVGVGGGFSVGGKAGIGASNDTQVVTKSTKAWIGDNAAVHAENDIIVEALTSEFHVSVAATAAIAYEAQGVAVQGSVSVHTVTNTVQAMIGDTAVITAGGDILVTADDEYDLIVVAAGVAGGGNVGVGGSVGVVVHTNTVEASIGSSTQVSSDGSVSVSASNDASVIGVAGSISIGGKAAGIGLSNIDVVHTESVQAFIESDAVINAKGNGAGVSIYTGSKENGNRTTQDIHGLAVTATSFESLIGVAAGGAGGGKVGVAGSATIGVLTDTTKAYIAEGVRINVNNTGAHADQSIHLLASDHTFIVGFAGALGIGGQAGIGAGADVGTITKTTQAFIEGTTLANDAVIANAAKDISIQALSSENIVSVSANAGIGGSAGIAGAASVYVLTTTTEAFLGDHTKAFANGNILVAADGRTNQVSVAGSVGGSGTAGIGASNTTIVHTDTVRAYVGKNAVVTAKGEKDGITTYTAADVSGDPTKSVIKGLSVTATSTEDFATTAVGGGFAGTVGIAGSATVNVLTETTSAFIDENAQINQKWLSSAGDGSLVDVTLGAAGQSVNLLALDNTWILSLSGAASGGGTVGIGAGIDVGVITKFTKSWIADNAVVDVKVHDSSKAEGNIFIQALSKERVISVTANAGIGGTVGIAGAVGASAITNQTQAYIGDADVHAQNNIVLSAEDLTQVDIAGGSISGGGTVGVGAGAGVGVITKTTEAFIASGAVVDADALGDASMVNTGKFIIEFVDDTGEEGEVESWGSSQEDDSAAWNIDGMDNQPAEDEGLRKDRKASQEKTSVNG